MKPGKAIKPKDRCCKSRPRCERCPVVLCRLEDLGYAERSKKKNRFVVTAKVKKKQLKAARI